ncbi:hypothetical protein C7M84_006437 [Penaeus vannamei]|uniref:Nucleotidyltransferase n=1 Tax=Penaeus vannamei TaxID=6689 RepID=A0A423TF04_PENVA|nr:hypothetical protein C7M84_006437 [Penaeus vannamei]
MDIHVKNDFFAKLIPHRVDAGVKQNVKRNAETVCDFADRLQKTFHNQNFLAGADVMHSGSAYEGLSVKPKTDFDVIVVLALKCLEDDFEWAGERASGRRTKGIADSFYLGGLRT